MKVKPLKSRLVRYVQRHNLFKKYGKQSKLLEEGFLRAAGRLLE